LVLGAWCLVLGAWCLVLGAWCLVLGAWCLVLGPWSLVLAPAGNGMRCMRPKERACLHQPCSGVSVTAGNFLAGDAPPRNKCDGHRPPLQDFRRAAAGMLHVHARCLTQTSKTRPGCEQGASYSDPTDGGNTNQEPSRSSGRRAYFMTASVWLWTWSFS
jgi:hypothetical protein